MYVWKYTVKHIFNPSDRPATTAVGYRNQVPAIPIMDTRIMVSWIRVFLWGKSNINLR